MTLAQALRQAIERGVRRWAARTANELRAAAPVATGTLRRSIRAVPVPLGARLVAGSAAATYTNRGTKPHPINPRRRRALAWQTPTGMVIVGPRTVRGWLVADLGTGRRGLRRAINAVMHPGIRGTGWWTNTIRAASGRLAIELTTALRAVRNMVRA